MLNEKQSTESYWNVSIPDTSQGGYFRCCFSYFTFVLQATKAGRGGLGTRLESISIWQPRSRLVPRLLSAKNVFRGKKSGNETTEEACDVKYHEYVLWT